MKKSILMIVSALVCLVLIADTTKDRVDAYVASFADMAVYEMYRSGVPASITLAQGLLESGFGRSVLATKANNHFGIKCHSDWTGEHINVDDDLKGECFRKYDSAQDSYRDHADFLRYKPRYASLFDYKITDYKSWAHGLKKAGYATDPQYATKLINLIETYNLSRFDTAKPSEVLVRQEEQNQPETEKPERNKSGELVIPESPAQLEKASRYTGSGRKGTFAVSLSREVLEINGTPFVYAREGESFASIAHLYDLFPKELMRFNDLKSDRPLAAGEVVYLQSKAKRAVKGLEKHICSEGETLRDIAQKYAVTVSALLKLNNLTDAGAVFHEDDTIYLRNQKHGKKTKNS